MKFSELVTQLSPAASSLDLNPQLNPEITAIAPVHQATKNSISYIEGDKFARMVATTSASALILPLDEPLQIQALARGIAWLASSHPRFTFAQAINLFYRPFQPAPQIHPSAVIDPSAQIGDRVYIGPNVVIYGKAIIGEDACIHPNVVIYPEVTIGPRTILHANCTIHERSQIGSDCVIHSGAVIGAEGFGFVPTPRGWYKMQQSGATILEDGVEVGCNSAIDRPAVGETRIGKDTKLDNLVHIGHNSTIGANCALAAQVGLAGGVTIGNQVMLGGQVGVANQAKIGDGAIATAQTGIHSDIKAGEVVSSSPAIPNKLYLKISAIYKRLPQMYQTIRELQKKVT